MKQHRKQKKQNNCMNGACSPFDLHNINQPYCSSKALLAAQLGPITLNATEL